MRSVQRRASAALASIEIAGKLLESDIDEHMNDPHRSGSHPHDVIITPHHDPVDGAADRDERRSKGDAEPPPPFWSSRFVSLILTVLVAAVIALVAVLGVVVSRRNDESADAAAADVLGRDVQPGIASMSSTTAATTPTTTAATGGITSTSSTASTTSTSAMNTFFCGRSAAHAAEGCTPCPSGNNQECFRAHRCFDVGLTGCNALSPTSIPIYDAETLLNDDSMECHGGCIIDVLENDIVHCPTYYNQVQNYGVQVVVGPSSGIAEMDYPSSIRYRPALDVPADSDEFVYEVCCQDRRGDSIHCGRATVHLQISKSWPSGEGWLLEVCQIWDEPCNDPVMVHEDTAAIVTDGVVHFFSYVDERFEFMKRIPYPHEGLPWKGLTIAMSNQVIALGVPSESLTLGAVYIFAQDVSGDWAWADTIYPNAAHSCREHTPSYFGASLDIDGNTMIVGSGIYHKRGDLQRGPAYIYRRIDDTWVQEAELPTCLSDKCSVSWSGNSLSVSLSGNFALVAVEESLLAYQFDPVTESWSQREVHLVSGGATAVYDGSAIVDDTSRCDRIEEVVVFLDGAFLLKCTGNENNLRFYVPGDDSGAYRLAQEVATFVSGDGALAVDESNLALEKENTIRIFTRENDAWLEVGAIDAPQEVHSDWDHNDGDGYYLNHLGNVETCAWLYNGMEGRTDRKDKNCGTPTYPVTELGDNCPDTCAPYNGGVGGVRSLSISGDKLLVSLLKESYFFSLSSLGVNATSSARSNAHSPESSGKASPNDLPNDLPNDAVRFEGPLFEANCGPPYQICSPSVGCFYYGFCYQHVKIRKHGTILVSRRPRLSCTAEEDYPEYCGMNGFGEYAEDLTLTHFPDTDVNISLHAWHPEPSEDSDTIDTIPITPSSQLPGCVQNRSPSAFALAGDSRILVACGEGDVYYYGVSEADETAYLLQAFTVGDPGSLNLDYSADVQMVVDGDIMAISLGNWEEDIHTATSEVYVFSRENDAWEMISRVCPPGARDKFFFGENVALSGNKLLVTSGVNVYLYSIAA